MTSAAIAEVSVFAFSVENVLEGAAGSGLTILGATGFGASATGFSAAGGGGLGTAAGCDGGVDEPPMLREMVGGGRGASVCSGRSMGGGGGCEGVSGTKPLPGTKEKAPGLSLLIVVGGENLGSEPRLNVT